LIPVANASTGDVYVTTPCCGGRIIKSVAVPDERSGIYAIFSSRGLNCEFVGTGLSTYSACHHSCDANSSYPSCRHEMIDGYRAPCNTGM